MNCIHFFDLLQQLVRKYLGDDRIVEQVFERMGGVNKIYLFGDCAKGLDTGVLEVVIERVNLNITYFGFIGTQNF